MPPLSGQKSRSHGKALVKGGTQTRAVQWATVALKIAGMSVRQYEQGFRTKRGKKNIFERKLGEKKNSEEEIQGGSSDGSYFWKDQQGTN
jgi:hypothetical protein